MKKRLWLFLFGLALLVSASPVVSSAGKPAAAQSTAKKKKKSSQSKAKKPAKAAGQKAPTPDRIRDIQSALQRQGAYQGEPNGKWDDATVTAMRKYQEDHGLNLTGKIDALSLQKLGLGSETAGKGSPTPTASSASPASSSAP